MEIFGDMMGACVKVKIFFISDLQKYFIMDLNVAPQQDLWLQAPLARLRLLATLHSEDESLEEFGTPEFKVFVPP